MNWISKNRNTIIRSSFLLPILLVVIISISHVVNWYEIGNPINWAIYLSIAIEIFALTSVSAATVDISKSTIWFLFILVTSIQLIGNVFFSYNHINQTSHTFLTWVEMITPLFEDWGVLEHKRFLALIQGGTLPIMSLTALHFYLKFNDNVKTVIIEEPEVRVSETTPTVSEVENGASGPTEELNHDSYIEREEDFVVVNDIPRPTEEWGNDTYIGSEDDFGGVMYEEGPTEYIEPIIYDEIVDEDSFEDEIVNEDVFYEEVKSELESIESEVIEELIEELIESKVESEVIEEPIEPKVESEVVEEPIEERRIKREDIREVKLRDINRSDITRVGSNKYQNGSSGSIVYDNGRRNRDRQ